MESIGLKAILDMSGWSGNVSKYQRDVARMVSATQGGASGIAGFSAVVPKASGALGGLSSSLGQASTSSQTAGASFGQMATKVAAFAATLGVISLVREFVGVTNEMARGQNDARNALTRLVGGAAEYKAAIEQVKTATRGTLSETEAARTAFGLLDNGIAKTAAEAAKYALAGKALNSALGNTASYEKFLMLLDEGSPMLLNNFNITGSQIDAQQKLVEANTELEGSEARLQAVREVALAKGLALADGISQETIAAQQAAASFADFQAAFGQLTIAVDTATGSTTKATTLFGWLTEGAKAWGVILNEQIPAIQAHDKSIAKGAASAALAAQSQEELAAAFGQGLSDVSAFKTALVAGAGSVEEYNAVVERGTEGNGLLRMSLTLTAEEFRQVGADAVIAGGQWVSSLRAMDIAIEDTKEKLRQLASFDGTTFAVTTNAIDAMTARYQGLANAQRTMPGGRGALETMAGGGTMSAGEAEAMAERQKMMDKMAKASATAMTKAFDQAAQDIRSTIESVIQPSLSEVWKPPEGAAIHIDEAARQLATVATSGFGSEWLAKLAAQFQGQPFFQPIIDAMKSGDPAALQGAATQLLTTGVENLWDIEVIKAKVREQLAAQNLRQQIIDTVQQELAAEGTVVTPEQITAIAGGTTEVAQGAGEVGAAVTTMGTDISTSQVALDTWAASLTTISTVNIPGMMAISEKLTLSIAGIATSVTTAGGEITSQFNDDLLPAFTKLSEKVSNSVVSAFNSFIDLIPDFKTGMKEVNRLIQDGTSYFEGLTEAVNNFSLPAVLTPGSPTPMELALTGIASAAGAARIALSGMGSGVNLSALAASVNSLRANLNQLEMNIVRDSIGGARDDIEKFFDSANLGGTKTSFALRILSKVFRDNSKEILAATDRAAKFKEIAGRTINWEKAGFSGGPGRILQAGIGLWIKAFDRALETNKQKIKELRAELVALQIQETGATITTANSLIDLAQSSANRLSSQVDTLAALLNTGATEFMFEGQLINATQAQDMLNGAMQEQVGIQDDLLALQQAQSQLGFLQTQLDLINQLNAAGLDATAILGDLNLGANASMADIVEAPNRAIQALIGQAEAGLGGLGGIAGSQGAGTTATPVTGSQPITNRSVNISFPNMTIANGMDANNLVHLIQQTAAGLA